MKRTHVLLLAAAALLCAIAITFVSRLSAGQSPTRRLARMELERPFAPRLSIPIRYHACESIPPDSADSDGKVPREMCGTSDAGSLKLREYARAGESVHPDSLRASALAGLIWLGDKEVSLDDAVTHLETAARVSGGSVAVLVDLSAAYLVRAERTDNPQDLFRGLDAAYRALAREPRNTSARFNAALALQRMGFAEQSALEWRKFLAVDSASPWANEVRQRMQESLARATPIAIPRPDTPAGKVKAFAQEYPESARKLGMNEVLGNWAAAIENGDAARADSQLNFAEALARALVGREKSDSSLTYAVAAIRAAVRNPPQLVELARAHQAYAKGQTYYNKFHLDSALAAFTSVMEARPRSEALLQWTRIYQAVVQTYLAGPDSAARDVETWLKGVNVERYPSLEGRGRITLGAVLGRPGDMAGYREQLRRATECFVRAGDYESITEVQLRDAEPAYELGYEEAAYRSMHHGLLVQLQNRQSADLHKYFIALGGWAERDEMPYAAWAIYNQGNAVAVYPRAEIDVLELHLARARVRKVVGDSLGAAADIAYASKWVDPSSADERQHIWAAASLSLARPEGVTLAQMDTAVDAFGENVVWLAPALARRAELHLAQRNVPLAIADLRRLTEGVRRLTEQEENPVFRGAIIEQARNVFDRLVMVRLADSAPDDALRDLERGRMSFAPRRAGQLPPGEGRMAAPPGHVAVEYALIRDTLITWTVGAESILAWRRPMDRDTFLLTVQQANAALQSVRTPVPQRALRLLYDWLIRPIANHLGGPGTPLVILADGEVAGVPFAALMDGDRYLIQNHSLRFAPTLEDAARPPPRGSGPVLLVADPAFDRILSPTLDSLPGARAEVSSLARFYQPNARVLQDTGATREAFIREARGARVVHYAGHAVFNDVRPERSYLLLADRGTAGRLTADEVSKLELENVRLVLLSACSTVRSRSGRSGGFAGLSGALLAAGAGGVVGSMWEVDDGLAGPLMQAFHAQYGKLEMDGARALREAQLHMLRSEDADQQSPAAWAGFRYMGG
jgi:CHAT domain-containing protein